MNKVRFLATFLVVFAVFLVLWSKLEASRWYTNAVLACASVVGPTLHGWVLERNASGGGAPEWVHGTNRVRTAIQFDALAVGVVPALALLAATPGLTLRRRGVLMCVGGVLCLLIDALIVALFPLLGILQEPVHRCRRNLSRTDRVCGRAGDHLGRADFSPAPASAAGVTGASVGGAAAVLNVTA